MSEPSRSPLKDKPLRLPGQSLMEERTRLFEDRVETWLLLGLLFAVVAGLEWWRYFHPSPPLPWLYTLPRWPRWVWASGASCGCARICAS